MFVYRLLTEGTVEDKVYARSVNKTGVAYRVIDGKSLSRCFSAREVEDLQASYHWVQCDSCGKWRILLGDVSDQDLPSKEAYWECSDNKSDPRNNSCSAPERTQKWYERNCFSSVDPDVGSPLKSMASESVDAIHPDGAANATLLARDECLQGLLELKQLGGNKRKRNGRELVSRHYFHDVLLESGELSLEELASLRQEAEQQQQNSDTLVQGVDKTACPDGAGASDARPRARSVETSIKSPARRTGDTAMPSAISKQRSGAKRGSPCGQSTTSTRMPEEGKHPNLSKGNRGAEKGSPSSCKTLTQRGQTVSSARAVRKLTFSAEKPKKRLAPEFLRSLSTSTASEGRGVALTGANEPETCHSGRKRDSPWTKKAGRLHIYDSDEEPDTQPRASSPSVPVASEKECFRPPAAGDESRRSTKKAKLSPEEDVIDLCSSDDE